MEVIRWLDGVRPPLRRFVDCVVDAIGLETLESAEAGIVNGGCDTSGKWSLLGNLLTSPRKHGVGRVECSA